MTAPDHTLKPFKNHLHQRGHPYRQQSPNAQKYCNAAYLELRLAVGRVGPSLGVDFIDNGTGIATENQDVIFEKFARLSDHGKAGGAGLGLAICQEVMGKLGGYIANLPGPGETAFRVTLPLAEVMAAQ